MFWPVVLPFQITACIIACVIAGLTLAAPLFKLPRLQTFLLASLLGYLAFVPSCAGVMAILNAHRFGIFAYDSFAEVDDFRVERYLPPTARSITIDKYPQGFRARYAITEAQLTAYLDDLWAPFGHLSTTKRGELSTMKIVDAESHRLRYGDLGWSYLPDAIEFHSPTAGNGAGFSVWFSPSKQLAYERAGYW